MNLITRKIAVINNLDFYFTGKPCKHGHVSIRSTKTRQCLDCTSEHNKILKTTYGEEIKTLQRSWYKKNSDKVKAKAKNWRSENFHKARMTTLKHKYKISQEELDKFLLINEGNCHICSKPETVKSKNGKIKSLALDHCHVTNTNRGMLCHSCNVGLGLFKDSTELLNAAIMYLNKN